MCPSYARVHATSPLPLLALRCPRRRLNLSPSRACMRACLHACVHACVCRYIHATSPLCGKRPLLLRIRASPCLRVVPAASWSLARAAAHNNTELKTVRRHPGVTRGDAPTGDTHVGFPSCTIVHGEGAFPREASLRSTLWTAPRRNKRTAVLQFNAAVRLRFRAIVGHASLDCRALRSSPTPPAAEPSPALPAQLRRAARVAALLRGVLSPRQHDDADARPFNPARPCVSASARPCGSPSLAHPASGWRPGIMLPPPSLLSPPARSRLDGTSITLGFEAKARMHGLKSLGGPGKQAGREEGRQRESIPGARAGWYGWPGMDVGLADCFSRPFLVMYTHSDAPKPAFIRPKSPARTTAGASQRRVLCRFARRRVSRSAVRPRHGGAVAVAAAADAGGCLHRKEGEGE
eukprot:15807-Chlamydomonas_euryale.AAC.4